MRLGVAVCDEKMGRESWCGEDVHLYMDVQMCVCVLAFVLA